MSAMVKRPVDMLKVELEKPAMVNWLQRQVAATMNRNASQLINVVLHAARQNEALGKCTPSSILASLCVSAQVGLVPNTALGHAWLVPFVRNVKKDGRWEKIPEAQLIIGYQGFAKLAHDAAGIMIQARPVYANEPFVYNRAAFPPVKEHQLAPGERGPLKYAYCLASDGSVVSGEVYDRAFIHERRAHSRSYAYRDSGGEMVVKKDSVWVIHEAAMWTKTAARDFLKFVPKGSDARLERAIEADGVDSAPDASIIDMVDLPPEAAALQEGDALAVEQAARQELGPGAEEELMRWTAEIRQTTTPKEHADVMAQIGAARLGGEMQQRLMEVAKAHASTLKGGR